MGGVVVIDVVQIIIKHKHVITLGDQRRSNAKTNARCTTSNDCNWLITHGLTCAAADPSASAKPEPLAARGVLHFTVIFLE